MTPSKPIKLDLKSVGIGFTTDQIVQLRATCFNRGVSRSQLVRNIMHEWLTHNPPPPLPE